ncbi:Glycylpeptide N-tetradecanoyltransferase [Seminavis robusta]|uniref:glycylpeptide N-tetradecanoyltransferase n=1 Tax=Seminavis robusta TaxID=568900 RepID=A0A9N8HYA9_9STRA|nr:Glycylpeptide N-tetradecanoyltransferase [Seminavis robusta]|eukprot:Sro2815_g337730.1 Glycylpeptide N-tetradecanoyltransferase (338) ;mRNA; r:254-1397
MDTATTVDPSHWRYLWDSQRRDQNVDVLAQLELHAQPLSSDEYTVVSAEEYPGGRDAFLNAAGDLLIRKHYVQDSDGIFRFCLHNDFLKWAINFTSTKRDDDDYSSLLVGITATKDTNDNSDANNPLVGLIVAVPLFLHHQDLGYSLAEEDNSSSIAPNFAMIDFVCVAEGHRGKRLCPFLYSEITKRCHARGIQHMICTSGDSMKTPYTSADYFHLPNPDKVPKLCEIGWLTSNWTPAQQERYQQRIRIVHPSEEESAWTPLRLLTADDDISSLKKAYKSFYMNDTGIEGGPRKGEMLRQAYVYYLKFTSRRDLLLAGAYWLFQHHPEVDVLNCLG